MISRPFLLLGISLNGLFGTVLGALGAHPLKDRLSQRGSLDAWQSAGTYQLVHVACSLALIAWAESHAAKATRLHRVVLWWQIGCLLFSGSIYLLALGGPSFLGPVTPLGGLAFMIGWALLAVESFHRSPTP
jgi:uncharacterized membrane protein YgdD (TMEM256/DUF423 family)